MRTCVRFALALALMLAAILARAQTVLDDPCGKNHYILSDPCPTWVPMNEGLTKLDVRVVAIDPTNSNVLYAGSTGTLFRSANRAATWKQTGLDIPPLDMGPFFGGPRREILALSAVAHIAIDPRNPRVLYAATNRLNGCAYFQRRLFKSWDSGVTWTEDASPAINGCDDILSLLMDPNDPSTLHVANFDNIMGDTWSPIVKSIDGATSWSYLGWGATPSPSVMAIDSRSSQRLYVGTYDLDSPTGVFRSDDGGATWSATELTGMGISAMASVDGTAYAAGVHGYLGWATFAGLFKSLDGSEWQAIGGGLEKLVGTKSPVTAIVASPNDPSTLYLATSGAGVWKSIDGGETWTDLTADLPTPIVRSIVIAPGSASTIYVATPQGVFARK